jgi:hypothetical protein
MARAVKVSCFRPIETINSCFASDLDRLKAGGAELGESF